jgi:hypothetical protein
MMNYTCPLATNRMIVRLHWKRARRPFGYLSLQ